MPNPPDDGDMFDVGVPLMDAEHRGQLERMQRLEQALAAGRPAAEIGAELKDLADFLEAHFLSEQITMRELAYPGFGAHDAEHDLAMALLRRLESRWGAGDREAGTETLRALHGWLVDHVRTADEELAKFVKRARTDTV